MKKMIFAVGLVLFYSITASAQASEVFNPAEGAIRGYDAVAYFKESKPVKGDKQYSFSWNTATWYFVNQQNLDSFKLNPERFAPQYGGYCAYGLAEGHKAPTDPNAWSITNGKLYLNYSKDVQATWKKKQAAYILQADKNWPALKNKE